MEGHYVIAREFGCKSIWAALHILVYQRGQPVRYLADGATICNKPGISKHQDSIPLLAPSRINYCKVDPK